MPFACLDPCLRRVAPIALAAWLTAPPAGAQSARTSSPVACPSPAPLYAARTFEPSDWVRVLHLPPAHETAAETRDNVHIVWDFELLRIWRPAGGACATAVVRGRMQSDIQESRTPAHLHQRVLALVDVDPLTQTLRVANAHLDEADWHVVADPTNVDIDGDGIPEHLEFHEDTPGARSYCSHRQGDTPPLCVGCGIPSGTSLTLNGSRGRVSLGPVAYTGRDLDVAFEARVAAMVRAIPPATSPNHCPPSPGPWVVRVAGSSPFVSLRPDGFTIEAILEERTCQGWWNNLGDDALARCTPSHTVLRTITMTGTTVHAESTAVPVSTGVTARCEGSCAMRATEWQFPDGDRSLHRVPVTFTAHEGRAGVGSVQLYPGFSLVEVTPQHGPASVWQVFVAPSQTAPVALTP